MNCSYNSNDKPCCCKFISTSLNIVSNSEFNKASLSSTLQHSIKAWVKSEKNLFSTSFSFCDFNWALIWSFNWSKVSTPSMLTSLANSSSASGKTFSLISWTVTLNVASLPANSVAW